MNGHEADDRLAMLALGELPESEGRELERHAATCDVCRAELADIREALAALPLATLPETPSERVKDAIFARLDVRTDASPELATRRGTAWTPLASGLAAALVLALLGDAFLLARSGEPARVAQVPDIAPSVAPRSQPSTPTAAPRVTPRPTPRATPASILPRRTPLASPSAVDLTTPSAAQADVAALRAALQAERVQAERARADAGAARARARVLAAALATARDARLAATTPSPESTPNATSAPGAPNVASPAPSDGASVPLLEGLQTGRVYAVDGVVANEPWHCTIVQPAAGNAFVVTRAPSAASGFEYRAWVLRGDTVFDAGALPPGRPETLAMPMPLARGDIVAFSLEPTGSSRPSTPYLMRVTITE